MHKDRYIYDALYGAIYFPDFIWKVLSCPELQRLREIRLCNINSLCLTGGANINRYEHSIGTCYLAQKCLEAWPLQLNNKEKKLVQLAALFHDITSTSFGHSVEYVESRYGFQHQDAFLNVIDPSRFLSNDTIYQYQACSLQPIYFGMHGQLLKIIKEKDVLESIGQIISGKGNFGPLINGSIDLDNIDNVFRLSYHIGLVKSGEIPLRLAQSLWVENDKLVVKESAVSLIEEWYEVRRKLYSFLLLNPDEFSAKCMLNEAIEIAKKQSPISFAWSDVDYMLLMKMADLGDQVKGIVSRLMIGDLYDCMAIFSSSEIKKYDVFNDPEVRKELELKISKDIRNTHRGGLKSAMIALHAISDINKTQRKITICTDTGRTIKIGHPTNRLLIGVFLKNAHPNMFKLGYSPEEIAEPVGRIKKYLSMYLDDDLKELDLYSEINET